MNLLTTPLRLASLGWDAEKDWKPGKGAGTVTDPLNAQVGRLCSEKITYGDIASGSEGYRIRSLTFQTLSPVVAAIQMGRSARRTVHQLTHLPLHAAGWLVAGYLSWKLSPGPLNLLNLTSGLLAASLAFMADPSITAWFPKEATGLKNLLISNNKKVKAFSKKINKTPQIPLGLAALFFGAHLLKGASPQLSLPLLTAPVSLITWGIIGHWAGSEAE